MSESRIEKILRLAMKQSLHDAMNEEVPVAVVPNNTIETEVYQGIVNCSDDEDKDSTWEPEDHEENNSSEEGNAPDDKDSAWEPEDHEENKNNSEEGNALGDKDSTWELEDHEEDNNINTEEGYAPDDDETAIPKLKCRKRKAYPETWIKNEAKKKRNLGEDYTSVKGKKIKGKIMKLPCPASCIYKCSYKVKHEQREEIFKNFWSLGDLMLQRQYVLKQMIQIKSKYQKKTENSIRKYCNNAYHFEINGVRTRVCKLFFMHTLNISDKFIRTVIKKNTDGFIESDLRGKHGKHVKVDSRVKDDIKNHINSIPRIESHYLRQQSSREYIEGGKTIAGLHRDYIEICKKENKSFGNLTMYSRIFNNEFNISFFTPKKDQCSLCETFKNSTEDEKEILKLNYEKHLKEKKRSREKKDFDKQQAKEGKCVTACFDLQAALPTPMGEVSSFYYKSKLSTYNFTIYNFAASPEGFCYIWHEGEAKRGSNEIGTCIFHFLKENQGLPVIFYSDNCMGQNKNKYLTSLYLYAVTKYEIPSITHNFLICGHTQNEGDGLHSLIEKQKKGC